MNYLKGGYALVSRYLSSISWINSKKNKNPFTTIPLDVIRYIFIWAKGDLPAIASVSKEWKAITYNQDFRNLIGLPTEHFLDNAVWRKLPGIDVEKEPHPPLCIYRDVGPKDFLALVHKNVIVDGQTIKLTTKLFGALVAKQIKGLNKTGFYEHSWPKAINEHTGSETMHWVWIKRDDNIGKIECFSEQEITDKRAGGVISEFFDTVVCLDLDRVKSESSEYNWDKTTWIRTKTKICDWLVLIGFASSGLYIFNNDFHLAGSVCVAFARKSIGT